ncbi:hypothetical protein HBH56_025540 [Parastagonospora nodorum]|uniref:N-acetylgalactosaminide beta-1,3-galactosyltransferase n=2 Tax=Phaeosphaeria nodorum (strain SN15 / ATCC MYA-4574 / FGSC 10173) TaxID=321614 RepID=Q0UPS1_PHANO|nr:hypothetical protein SNOG_06243 [Parastagonospora nodorum SN15]KAH3918848.1 hypothetical protein HBH56_025540 [Parastagonospora nodorum]EAT86074.1 hypothetical protein SNOG_06243 [Parastagonospora nodorum SN15]KAH3934316.1 hypothetical protein HBH54_056470 [Parastagonospora nodorum]KAH4142013.1 hypothetical protein HBH45_060280 [Parastagonospora nodorum]KAH4161571.1 hypothetical protein HBH44_093870 [Parastagonospora nodorum]
MISKTRNEKRPHWEKPMRSSFTVRRYGHLKIITALVLIFVLFYERFVPTAKFDIHYQLDLHPLECPTAPITDEILVVLRTGATEALEKLPVHFDTTLKCVPNYVIYSDYEGAIQGHKIHDVLDEVSSDLKRSAPEFKLYSDLKIGGRSSLLPTEHSGSGPSGSLENPSWKLDKFKFLPMVDRAFRHGPDAKWFVFVEADTYLMWTNLVAYLGKLDASKELYIGKHMFIGDVLFAHGGSGFALSAAAMRKVTEHWRDNIDEYDQYTTENWAGDMVLGKVLRDVGVQLFWAFPHFQGDPVSALDHNVLKVERRPWCYAPITYHHMRDADVRQLWDFEQAWQRKRKGALSHRVVFKEFILPRLATRHDNWDNLSVNLEPGNTTSLDDCRALCQTKATCLQYKYATNSCFTSDEVRFGEEAWKSCLEYSVAASKCVRWQDGTQETDEVQSGWMLDRLPQYVDKMDSLCDGAEDVKWVV